MPTIPAIDQSGDRPARPLLFLDIDGVLNRIGPDFPRARPEGGRGAQLWIPEGTAERVGRLLEVFEPVWASAWRGYSHKAMRSGLGLKGPAWPYLRFHESKLRAIMEYAGKRFWAWVDDEPDGQTIIGQRGMIVTPDPKVGLTDGQVKALLTFASQLRFVNSSN